METKRTDEYSIRKPLCTYFSSDCRTLWQQVEDCFSNRKFGPGLPTLRKSRHASKTFLLPHGAFCDSGYVAAFAFKQLAESLKAKSRLRVICIGTVHSNHRANTVALCSKAYQTPIGVAHVSSPILKEMLKKGYKVDNDIHAKEHSIENQIPFLLYINWLLQLKPMKGTSIEVPPIEVLPIIIGRHTSLKAAQTLAKDIANVVKSSADPIFVCGTTDYTHAGPCYGHPPFRSKQDLIKNARELDLPVIQALVSGTAEEALNVVVSQKVNSMCGLWPALVTKMTARFLGKNRGSLLNYRVNVEIRPLDSSTGFASIVFESGLPSKGTVRYGKIMRS